MRLAALAIVALGFAASASAQVYVDGHVRRDGTYVPGHYRSAPNNTRTDNWSSQPNVNPYNGRQGTVDPYQPSYPRSSGYNTPRSPSYSPPPPSNWQQPKPMYCAYTTSC